MSYPRSLLRHAASLLHAGTEVELNEAHLRRAVSAAYYSLFHLITQSAAASVADGRTRGWIARVVQHRELKAICSAIESANRAKNSPLPGLLGEADPRLEVPDDLRLVARAVSELQAARHEADYNLAAPIRETDVVAHIQTASAAFDAWDRVRSHPTTQLFLLAVLFADRGKR